MKKVNPATGSPTATLLWLRSSQKFFYNLQSSKSSLKSLLMLHINGVILGKFFVALKTSSKINFRSVTGGVYKAQVRIHRGMLIRDY